MVSSGRRPGRPGPGEPRLSRAAILEAALRIVDEDGIAALTMRRLAADLGVNPMSIYHHLPGKGAVLAGLVERVFSQLPATTPSGGSWQQRLASAAQAYRRIVRAHPHLALQIISDPAAVAGALVAAGEPFYAALELAGLPPRAIVEAVDTTIDFIHGFMLGEVASAAETFELGPDLLARVSALPPGAAPALTRVAEALGESNLRYEFDRGFEAGLAILIRGIEATPASGPPIG
jgi:AcrR family transcriptional regulator